MLLVHQAGHVKVGEVVRYTITYTPSSDRILPSPSHLYVRIKNACPIPLRAAYLHGPYALHVSAYPSTFSPNRKVESPQRQGVPEFEPNLKAGGSWQASLVIPEDIRESGEKANIQKNIDGSAQTATWIVEITSQILFSNTAAVNFELIVGRDERSLDLGFAAIAGRGHGEPGQINDFKEAEHSSGRRETQPKGVYSKAVDLVVEDTAALWNKPPLPQWGEEKSQLPTDEYSSHDAEAKGDENASGPKRRKKPKKVHLVVLTHGIHSNVGADMLYMKESIDGAAREAREAAREAKKEARRGRDPRRKDREEETHSPPTPKSRADSWTTGPANLSGGQDQIDEDGEDEEDDDDDELVIVRGFSGNACRTERGIQYLGKRLAKFVLTTTYPDQPFLPATKQRSFPGPFGSGSRSTNKYGSAVHNGSKIVRQESTQELPYTFSSISFIGHSLGGLVQTYAVAYIHKHSPQFFEQIKPTNFINMATPMLGLSNENPIYVKFALDFGLVGRTGKDLGLTWRAPTIARSGWSAMISGLGSSQEKEAKQSEIGTKPLLRILPTGPAHQVLKMFRNRTLYSNVVNDGIVPLRTSCLLFLDWRGLDKVENARRENGIIGTMAAFGWAELTGANSTSHRTLLASAGSRQGSRKGSPNGRRSDSPQLLQLSRLETDVPQPSEEQSQDKVEGPTATSPSLERRLPSRQADEDRSRSSRSSDGRLQSLADSDSSDFKSYTLPGNRLTDLINYFRPSFIKGDPERPKKLSKTAVKTYKRAQTMQPEAASDGEVRGFHPKSHHHRPVATRGDSIGEDPNARPPPKTSIFDAASDILNPPIPPHSWLLDPSKRDRTIFHDRIYHPEDIPAPLAKKPRLSRSLSINSQRSITSSSSESNTPESVGSMRVEEKIARAYHNGMAWRKVLVRLEPDAHNNMIVRRMFANAYGWDVVKHLCDTHFADTYTARTQDDEEMLGDRAKPMNEPVTEDGEEVRGQTDSSPPPAPEGLGIVRSHSEKEEAADKLVDLDRPITATAHLSSSNSSKGPKVRKDSIEWTDSVFDDGEDADDTDDEYTSPLESFQRFWRGGAPPKNKAEARKNSQRLGHKSGHHRGRNAAFPRPEVADTLTQEPAEMESHRGLGTSIRRQPLKAATVSPKAAAVSPAAEVDAIEPLMAKDTLPYELDDPPTSAGGTSKAGLRKPLDARVGETVARLSAESQKGKARDG